MNWSFESMQTAKKKDAEQLAARIASDALVASAKSDRKPKQSEAPKPVRRVTLGRLVNRCLQVTILVCVTHGARGHGEVSRRKMYWFF